MGAGEERERVARSRRRDEHRPSCAKTRNSQAAALGLDHAARFTSRDAARQSPRSRDEHGMYIRRRTRGGVPRASDMDKRYGHARVVSLLALLFERHGELAAGSFAQVVALALMHP